MVLQTLNPRSLCYLLCCPSMRVRQLLTEEGAVVRETAWASPGAGMLDAECAGSQLWEAALLLLSLDSSTSVSSFHQVQAQL